MRELRASFLSFVYSAIIIIGMTACWSFAQTLIDGRQIQFSKPITVPGPLTVTPSDPENIGYEFQPVSSPKPPAAGDLLLFLNKNTGHLSVMDPAGNIRDLMPSIVNQGAVP